MFRNALRPIASFAVFAAVVAAVCVVVLDASNPGSHTALAQDDAEANETSLHDHMEAIGDSMRTIFSAAREPGKRDEALAAIATLQKHLVAAKNIPAPGLDQQPESERDGYNMGFRKSLSEVLVEVAKLEIEVIEGRNEAALERIRNTLIPLRNAAHEKYQVD